jgi:hypothetical protein
LPEAPFDDVLLRRPVEPSGVHDDGEAVVHRVLLIHGIPPPTNVTGYSWFGAYSLRQRAADATDTAGFYETSRAVNMPRAQWPGRLRSS